MAKNCGPNLSKYAKKHGIMDKITAAMGGEEEKAEKGFMKQGKKGEKVAQPSKKY